MSMDKIFKHHFSKVKFFCSGLSVLILIWMGCHLFIRSCGGPFPNRTRGPFAEYRYYNLADFPDWENQIKPDPITGKTRVEELIETGKMPPLKFGKPEIGMATPVLQNITR